MKQIGIIVGMVLVFLVLAPPIGGAVFISLIGSWLSQMGAHEEVFTSFYGVSFVLFLPLAYWFGSFPAILLGLGFGVWQALIGRISFVGAASIGLLAGMSVAASLVLPYEFAQVRREFAVLTLSILVPTVICWFLMRNWVLMHKTASSLQKESRL